MARLVFNINASPYIHSLNQIYSPKSIRCFGRYCAYHWVKNAFSGPSTVSAQNHPSTARTYIWCGCSSCCGPTGLLVVYVCMCVDSSWVWAQQHPTIMRTLTFTNTHIQSLRIIARITRNINFAASHEQASRRIAALPSSCNNCRMYIYSSLFARNKTSGRAYKRKKNHNLKEKSPEGSCEAQHTNDGGRDVGGRPFSFAPPIAAARCCLVVRPSRHFNTQRRRLWRIYTQEICVWSLFGLWRASSSHGRNLFRVQDRGERVNTKCCSGVARWKLHVICAHRRKEMKTSPRADGVWLGRSNWFWL